MSRTLFALMPEEGEPWACVQRLPAGRFEPVEAPQPRDRVIVFVPAEDVVAAPLRFGGQLPEGNPEAATFAIEDELAEPPEQVHTVVSAPLGAGAPRMAFAASRATMEAWTGAARTLPGTVLLVPPQSLFTPSSSPVICGPVCLGWSVDRPVAADMAFPPDARAVLVPGSETAPRVSDPLSWLANLALQQARLVDLRTGRYGARAATGAALKPWRVAAALAVTVGAVSILNLILSLNAAEALDTRLRARAAADYAAIHPGAVLPATLAEAVALDPQGARAAGFRELAARLYASVEASGGRVRIKSMRYEAASGQLQAKLILRDVQAGDEIAASLKSASPGFRQEQFTAEGGLFEMDITLGAMP
jgi:general secretion pathway protein L